MLQAITDCCQEAMNGADDKDVGPDERHAKPDLDCRVGYIGIMENEMETTT